MLTSSQRETPLQIKMSQIKWLNNLLFLENLFGVYRNFCSQERIKQYFIIFHIFVQTLFHIIIVVIEQFWLFGDGDYDQLSYITCYYSVTANITALAPVVTAICYSSAFISYFESISRVSEYFKDDKKFNNSLKKMYWFSLTFTLLMLTFVTYRSVEILFKVENKNPSFLIPILVSEVVLRINIVFQYFILFVVIMIVVHLFKCLISLISAIQERVGSSDISLDEKCDIREQIQGWVELYRDLSNCCEKVTLCFGHQFFITLSMSILSYVVMLYNVIYSNAFDKATNSDQYKRVLIVILIYTSAVLMPVVAGQLVQNQGVKLRRVLARFFNAMTIDSCETEMKLLKDLIRLIKKNPIEIKLLSNIPAGMYMLPVILTFTVNYVIVLLQFNHII